jgi:hypothetical protein
MEITRPGTPTMRGIVWIEKDTFTFCYITDAGGQRPSRFDKLSEGQTLMTCKRLAP